MKNGRQRHKSIRRMSRDGTADLRRRCAERRERYEFFRHSVGADHVLTRHAFTMWHDAEFALSIQEGFYDHRSEVVKFVLRRMHSKGLEYTAADLDECRLRVMPKFAEVTLSMGVPHEFGFVIRMLRQSMPRGVQA